MDCGFAGNSDVFGIGIRFGYYSQVIAVWFSNYFLGHEAGSLRAVNNLFLIALITAGFIYFVNAPNTQVIEAFLLLQIGLVTGLVGITEATRFSTKYKSVSVERLVIRTMTIGCGSIFNVLFWWKGLDMMLPTPCGAIPNANAKLLDQSLDGTYAFYMWRANIYGWVRTLMKVQSLFAAVWTAQRHISHDAAMLIYNQRMRGTRREFVQAILGGIESSVLSLPSTPRLSVPHFSQTNASVPYKAVAKGPRKWADQRTTSVINKQSLLSTVSISNDGARSSSRHSSMLSDLTGARAYLASILSVYSKSDPNEHQRRQISLCKGFLRCSIPDRRNRRVDSTPYLRCLLRTLLISLDHGTLHHRHILALHFTISGEHSIFHWPRFLSRAYELNHESPGPPDWQHLMIASDLHLIQIPSTKTTRTWISEAILQFLLIAALIVQVELTIVWNNISNLNSLAPLGQLIPFIIGLGGLIKVLWGKARSIRSGTTDGLDRGVKPKNRYEEALDEYLGWGDGTGREKMGITRAATA